MIELIAVGCVVTIAIVVLVLACNRIDNKCVTLISANEDLRSRLAECNDKDDGRVAQRAASEVREFALRSALESLAEADIGLAKLALRMVYGHS